MSLRHVAILLVVIPLGCTAVGVAIGVFEGASNPNAYRCVGRYDDPRDAVVVGFERGAMAGSFVGVGLALVVCTILALILTWHMSWEDVMARLSSRHRLTEGIHWEREAVAATELFSAASGPDEPVVSFTNKPRHLR